MHDDTMSDDLGIEVVDVSADTAVALDPITRAEIDIAIATAKRYPRQIARFADEVLSLATIDDETAEGCFYSLRRQGKTIQGPSVRLAEIAVNAWGNIRAGARILGKSEDGRFVRAQGVCHDLEKNVFVAMESQRRITKSNGQAYGDDMVGVTGNAAAAIGFRNAVFKVIPLALVKPVYRKCIQVATGNAKTLTEKREHVFERLRQLNPMINDERILASLGRPSIDEVTLDDVGHLIGLGTAIKDGQQSIDEAFPEPEKLTAGDVLGNGGNSKEAATKDDKTKATKKGAANKVKSGAPMLTPSKIASLRRQAEESADMDTDSLDAWCQLKFGEPLPRVAAEHEAEVLSEIRRVANSRDKSSKKNR